MLNAFAKDDESTWRYSKGTIANMGTTHRFLAVNDEVDVALDWFLRQPESPEVFDKPHGQLLYYRTMGALAKLPDGSDVDATRSPVVSLFRPTRRRGVLWTTGEVHFLPTPLRRVCPPLHALSQRFKRWLSGFDLVFTVNQSWSGEWNYFLEGSIRNLDAPVYAFPLAAQALKQGQYFVAWSDNEHVLETLCRTLRHRGVNCTSNGQLGPSDTVEGAE